MPWQALYRSHLVWEDERSPVADGCFEKLAMFNSMENTEYPLNGVRYVTHDTYDFNWSLNHVTITIERTGDHGFILYFDTITPNFEEFKVDISPGDAKYISGNKYVLNSNFYDIMVSSINMFGMAGPISFISIVQ